jgi:hypothetical protein
VDLVDDVSIAHRIKSIQFGDFEVDTWYSAPYPEEYNQQDRLYLCEYCLKYLKDDFGMTRHKKKCPLRCPPGNEIFRCVVSSYI